MQSVCATRRHSHAYGTGEKYSRVEHEDVIDEEDEQLASGATRGTKVECICKRRMHNRYPASWHGTGFGAQCGHDTCQGEAPACEPGEDDGRGEVARRDFPVSS